MNADLLEELRRAYGALDGLALLRAVLRHRALAGRTALVSSFGAESIVLLDMVASVDPATPVIFLDTGKLFPETRAYREAVTRQLGLRDVRIVRPALGMLAPSHPDEDLWRRDPDLCCAIRKTGPLRAALASFVAWITGRKRFQGGVRSALPTIEGDPATGRIKINPLAPWSIEDVREYQRLGHLPPHPLVARGYRSIGCVPCTCPVGLAEGPRAGRWPGLDKSECGIHLGA
jgi:phosphoadenosine phosphosulfate reductase